MEGKGSSEVMYCCWVQENEMLVEVRSNPLLLLHVVVKDSKERAVNFQITDTTYATPKGD